MKRHLEISMKGNAGRHKKKIDSVKSSQDLYHNGKISSDYWISNNLNLSKVSGDPQSNVGNE